MDREKKSEKFCDELVSWRTETATMTPEPIYDRKATLSAIRKILFVPMWIHRAQLNIFRTEAQGDFSLQRGQQDLLTQWRSPPEHRSEPLGVGIFQNTVFQQWNWKDQTGCELLFLA